MKNYKALIAGIFSGFLFGFTTYFVKIFLKLMNNDVYKYLTSRYVIGFITMTLMIFFGVSKINFKNKSIRKLILIGLLTPVVSQSLEITGSVFVDMAQTNIIKCLTPVWTVVIAVAINKEKTDLKQCIFLFLTVLGVVITQIGSLGRGSSVLGLLLTIGCTVSIAFQRGLTRRWSESYSAFEVVYIQTACGAIVFSVISIVQHIIQGNLGQYFVGYDNPQVMFSVLFNGIVTCVFGFMLLTYSVSHQPIAISQSVQTLQNIVGIIVGVVLLNDKLSLPDIVGVIIMFVGVFGASLCFNPQNTKQNEFSIKKI